MSDNYHGLAAEGSAEPTFTVTRAWHKATMKRQQELYAIKGRATAAQEAAWDLYKILKANQADLDDPEYCLELALKAADMGICKGCEDEAALEELQIEGLGLCDGCLESHADEPHPSLSAAARNPNMGGRLYA